MSTVSSQMLGPWLDSWQALGVPRWVLTCCFLPSLYIGLNKTSPHVVHRRKERLHLPLWDCPWGLLPIGRSSKDFSGVWRLFLCPVCKHQGCLWKIHKSFADQLTQNSSKSCRRHMKLCNYSLSNTSNEKYVTKYKIFNDWALLL